MPIVIHRIALDDHIPDEEIAFLCEGDWEMPSQLHELEHWLEKHHSELVAGRYVIEVGLMPRLDAAGGGAVLTADTMKLMADLGMDLFLSEYRREDVAAEQQV